MSTISSILKNEYEIEYDLKIRKDYSEPKIYNANGDLQKRWYIYFSFRNPKTGKLERQTPIYGGINQFKTLRERKEAAKNLCEAVKKILKTGFNPYTVSKLDEIEKNYSIKDAFEEALKVK
jgi:hypothetical protein